MTQKDPPILADEPQYKELVFVIKHLGETTTPADTAYSLLHALKLVWHLLERV